MLFYWVATGKRRGQKVKTIQVQELSFQIASFLNFSHRVQFFSLIFLLQFEHVCIISAETVYVVYHNGSFSNIQIQLR